MDPLSLSASVIAVLQITSKLVSALYEYRAGVSSASRDAARVIAELNALRSVLEGLLSVIEAESSSPPAYAEKAGVAGGASPRLATIVRLARPGGELSSCRAELERLAAKLQAGEESKLGRMKNALMWPLRKEQVDSALESLQRAKSTMSLALMTDNVVIAMETQQGVSGLTESFAQNTLDHRKTDIRTWLAAPDPFTNHSNAKKKRQYATGEWFLKGKSYEDWKVGSVSFLWLYGIPGAGKSVLCSSVIDDISNLCISQPSTALAYYYFDFNDLGKRDVQSMVQALVAQLVTQCPSDSKSLTMLYPHIQRGVQPPDTSFLTRTLRSMIQEFQQAYIILDALDECSECEDLMGFIEEIHSWGISHLHIITTSRQLSEIEETISECATDKLCLQDSMISSDIVMLIHSRLDTDRKFQKWPADVRTEIEETLTKGAGGMFRWVVCQLDMLRNCLTLNSLKKALSSLPKTLDETYERILANIDESYTAEVQKVLQYLTSCQWRPTLAEMVEVLAIDWDAEEPYFDAQNRIPEPKDIINMCSSLVTTYEGRIQIFGDRKASSVTQVRLAHFSVKEYLTSPRIRTSKASIFAVSSLSSSLFITRTYLTYLLQSSFSTGHSGMKSTLIRYREYPLTNASAQLWPTQIRSVSGDEIDDKTKELIVRFFNTRHLPNGGNYATWVGLLIPEAPPSSCQSTHPLYYCASYGITSLVKLLLEMTPNSEIDTRSGRAESSPLHVAVFRGQVECVKLLLDAGADPNSMNNRRENCLFWARGKSRKVIYNLLVQYGAKEPGTSFESRYGVAA